jgi:hypothetical protein
MQPLLQTYHIKSIRGFWQVSNSGEKNTLVKNFLYKVIASKLLEDDNIWPNDIDHPVTKEFDENVRRFFSCHISMSCPLVQEMQRHFFESLISHTLDCTKKTDLEILQTSLLMYHCEFLVLNNLESNSGCYKALCQGQRYFYHLVRLDLQFTSTFNDRSTNGKKIIRIVHKITKRGFDVTQRKAE